MNEEPSESFLISESAIAKTLNLVLGKDLDVDI